MDYFSLFYIVYVLEAKMSTDVFMWYYYACRFIKKQPILYCSITIAVLTQIMLQKTLKIVKYESGARIKNYIKGRWSDNTTWTFFNKLFDYKNVHYKRM